MLTKTAPDVWQSWDGNPENDPENGYTAEMAEMQAENEWVEQLVQMLENFICDFNL